MFRCLPLLKCLFAIFTLIVFLNDRKQTPRKRFKGISRNFGCTNTGLDIGFFRCSLGSSFIPFLPIYGHMVYRLTKTHQEDRRLVRFFRRINSQTSNHTSANPQTYPAQSSNTSRTCGARPGERNCRHSSTLAVTGPALHAHQPDGRKRRS